MRASEVLTEAKAAGIELFCSGDRLRYRGPREVVQRLRPLLAEHRDDLLRLLTEDAAPGKPCPACGSGAYYRAERGGLWRCWSCNPPERGPVALHLVPGGRVPAGEPQGVDAVLAAAVKGLDITASEVRQAMEPADLENVAAGRIGAAKVRAFAKHMTERRC